MFWFSLLGFVRPAIQIFLLPLYLLYLTPADYGLLALVGIFTTVVAVFGTLRLDAAVRTFYFDFHENKEKLWEYISQIFSAILFIGIGLFIVLSIIGPKLFDWIFVSESVDFYPYGFLSLAAGFLLSFTTVYFVYLKNEVRLREYMYYMLSLVLMTILLQVYFVMKLEMGVLGILYGHLIASAVIFVAVCALNPKLLVFRFTKKMLMPSLAFSIPLIPYGFLYEFEKTLDKLMIERYLDIEKVGLYALLMGLIATVGILMNAMNNAMRPFLYRTLKEKTAELQDEVDTYLKVYLIVGILGISGIIMIGSNLDFITSDAKYLSIRPYFIWAGLATIPLLFVRYFVMVFFYFKKSKALTIATIIKTLLMILLMMYLVPKMGMMGAILAVGISYVVNAGIFYGLNRNYGMPDVSLLSIALYAALFSGTVWAVNYGIESVSMVGIVQFLISIVIFIPLLVPHLKKLSVIKLV